MLYLLWGLLNTGLFLFFIVLCFRATKLVREKSGLLASLVFVFGLLSFIGHSNTDNDNKEPNSNQIKTWKFLSEDSLHSNMTSLTTANLETTWISQYELGINYCTDRQGQLNIPISAYSSTTGFISGTNWKPISIIVNRTNDNTKFQYFVEGVVEWKLLGATIYSEPKQYKGVALIK